MTDNAVELTGVTKCFGPHRAVDDVDLEIPQGSIYGFIGPNGSGKTTTIRMILRILHPDNGQVRVLGRDFGDCADDRVGYLPEERGLYRRMKVMDLLRYYARLKGCFRCDDRIRYWLDHLGASDWGSKKIDGLSKGMAQKVQFISAIIAEPELLILDEPFSGLDPVNLDVLRSAIFELRDRGTTIIFSTHDMDVAERMCDRVFMIDKGRKVLDGSLDMIQRDYPADTLRVRMADSKALPAALSGVISAENQGPFSLLRIQPESGPRRILEELMEAGTVEHFELLRPSLHRIFVGIAGEEAEAALAKSPGDPVGSEPALSS